MKEPEKNEIVIAFQTINGLKIESRSKADCDLVCSWPEAVYLVDEVSLLLLNGMLDSMRNNRHALNATPLQTVHS